MPDNSQFIFNNIIRGYFPNDFTEENLSAFLGELETYNTGHFNNLNQIAMEDPGKDVIINSFNFLKKAIDSLPQQPSQVIKRLLDLSGGFFKLGYNSSEKNKQFDRFSVFLKFFASLIKQKNINSFDTEQNSKTNHLLGLAASQSVALIKKLYNQTNQQANVKPNKQDLYLFAENFGLVAYESRLKDTSIVLVEEYHARFLDQFKEIFDIVSNDLSADEKQGLAWKFASSYQAGDSEGIKSICNQLGLIECHPFSINTTMSAVPAGNTTPSINDTISTDIVSTTNVTNLSGDIDIQTKYSDSEINVQDNKQFPLGSKIGTAMGLGGFAGVLNGSSQVILHIAERKNCSINTQRLLAVTLAVANSFAICTLPLIYSIVEDFANEQNDPLVNSQKLLTCTYAFITSIALQSINAGVHYVLPKKSILKNLFSMLPLFAGLWLLAKGEEGAIESLAILGAHILTSIATSSLIHFAFNRYRSVPTRNRPVISAPIGRPVSTFNGADAFSYNENPDNIKIKMNFLNKPEESSIDYSNGKSDPASDTVSLLTENQTNGFHRIVLANITEHPENTQCGYVAMDKPRYDIARNIGPVIVIEDKESKNIDRDLESEYVTSDKSDTKSDISNRNSLEDPIYEAIGETVENSYQNKPLPPIPSNEKNLVTTNQFFKPPNSITITEERTIIRSVQTVYYGIVQTN